MKFSTAFLLFPAVSTLAFSPYLTTSSGRPITSMASSARDILARAREKAGVAVDDEYPKLYSGDLLEDMAQVLLTLEKRVQEGPETLSKAEFDDMKVRLDRILGEMRQNEHLRPKKPKREESSTLPAAAGPSAAVASAPPVRQHASQPEPSAVAKDISDDEGPEYDGRGGMGQPRGTVNTYVIDGMDEMTPEEYQQALQQSVIDRQRARRKSGVVGNKSTWDYLNSLTGEKGILRE